MKEREPTTIDEMRLAMNVFLTVCELDDQERSREIDRRTAHDPALRRRVERLLEADAESCWLPSDLDGTTSLDVRIPASDTPAPRIEGYELLEELGGGGMAVVYRAEQRQPIRRIVAVKVLRPGFDETPTRRRFELEQHLLARMNHPSIAQVFDAGITECGRPFVSMELIDGPKVTEYCRDARLSIRERIRLSLQICGAVSHAHRHGILHRDLKPSNILVAQGPDGATPKVIDFGIAKPLTDPIAESEGLTMQRPSGLLGTPEYMSPEQVLGNVDVDVRSDVFSLGIVWVELLLGELPEHRRRRRSLPLQDLVDEVRSREEPRLGELASVPSTRASHVSASALRGDLEWIAQRALELDRDRRYESVSAFADDLRRHLEHRPVVAAPPDALRRALRFARRNRKGVAVLAILVLSILSGAASVMLGLLEVREQRARAQWSLYVARITRAAASLSVGNIATASLDLEACDESHRHWEWDHLALRADVSLASVGGPVWTPTAFATSPDDRYLAVGTQRGNLFVWDLEDFEVPPRRARNDLGVRALAFHPRGDRLAWAYRDGSISILDVATLEVATELRGHEGAASDLAYSRDGTRIYSVGLDATLRVWDSSTGDELAAHRRFGDELTAVDVSPDGRQLAVIGREVLLHLWSLPALNDYRELRWNRAWPRDLVFSPNGSRIYTTANRHVQVWNVETGSYDIIPHEYTSELQRLAVSSDGRRLAVTTLGPKLSVRDLVTGTHVELQGHHGSITGVAFLSDGRRIATTSDDETVRLWDADFATPSTTIRYRHAFETINARDGHSTLVTQGGSVLQFWDTMTGNLLGEVAAHESHVFDVERLPDGRILTTGDNRITIWNADASKKIREIEPGVRAGDLDADERTYIASDWGNGVCRFDLETGALLWRAELETNHWNHPEKTVAVSGSVVLVAGCDPRNVRRLHLETGNEIERITIPVGEPRRIAIRPGGREFAAATFSRIYIVDLATHETLRTIRAVGGRINELAYSKDGRRLLASTERPGSAVQIFDSDTGDHLLRLEGDGSAVRSFAMFDDESRVALVTESGSLVLHETSIDVARSMNDARLRRTAVLELAERLVPETADLDELTAALTEESAARGIEPEAVDTVIASMTPEWIASILRGRAWDDLSVWGKANDEYRRASAWIARVRATFPTTEDRYLRILAAYRTGRWLEALRATLDLDRRLVPRYGRFVSPIPTALARALYAVHQGKTDTAERIVGEAREFIRSVR